jgi:hypothetical protein
VQLSLIASMDFLEDDGQEANGHVENDILELMNAWRTEVHAPEILKYREDLIMDIKELLDNQKVSRYD